MKQFEDLLGNILTKIEIYNDEIIFTIKNGEKYKLYHSQDCCESVYIEDIEGDLIDLLEAPILLAEEVTNNEKNPVENYHDSFTWTFYKLATIKGSITVRFYGQSNGYYSESVDFVKID